MMPVVHAACLVAYGDGFYETFSRQMRSTDSPWLVVGIIGSLAGVLFVAYWLTSRFATRERRPPPDDPQALFRTLLSKLGLSPEQSDWLKRVAKDLHLSHPAVLLISSRLFDEQVEKWSLDSRAHTAGPPRIVDPEMVALTRVMLFPE